MIAYLKNIRCELTEEEGKTKERGAISLQQLEKRCAGFYNYYYSDHNRMRSVYYCDT